MNLSGAIHGLVHEVDVFKQLHVHGCDFTCVMAPQDMIHLIQRRQVILPCVITVTDLQPFVRMHVEKREFGIRKLVRPRGRRAQKPAAKQQKANDRRFQEISASPRPGF